MLYLSPHLALAEDTLHFNIPRQQADEALLQFGTQADISVVYEHTLVKTYETNPLLGLYTPEQGIRVLLKDSGLQAEFKSSSHLVVTQIEGIELMKYRKNLLAATIAFFGAGGSYTAIADDADNKADEGYLLEVVITGSRIGRSEYDSTAPITALEGDVIERSGVTNIGEILLKSPVFGTGLGAANANFSDDAGAAFANLRGLGSDRTLVLVNGRRRVSGSNLSSAVDLTTIPVGMIERVEVVTGGASAVYGADAVSGAVNILLKKDMEGVEVSVQGGAGSESGGENHSMNIFGGTKFNEERGSVQFGVSYSKNEQLDHNQRDFSSTPLLSFANGNNTGPNDGIFDNVHYYDARLPATDPAGTFVIGGTRYTVDPNLRPVQSGITSVSFFGEGGDGFNPADYGRLRIGSEILSTMGTLDYKLTEELSLFAEFSWANVKAVDARNPSSFDNGLVISRDNPFIPVDVAALMDANALTELSVSRTHESHGLETNDLEKDTYTFVGGLDGQLSNEINWKASYQYGQYDYESGLENTRRNSRFANALDAITDPVTGSPVCRSPEARAEGCVPFSVFGRATPIQGSLDYFLYTRQRDVKNTQEVFSLEFNGDIYDVSAGSVEFAGGLEYREETLKIKDDPISTSGDVFRTAVGSQPLDADFDVSEVYVEFLVPLLSGEKYAESLEFDTALRYSDYSTIGDTTAWKYGLAWAPIEGFRLRGNVSRSVRAPNLNELFSPGVGGIDSINDPCNINNINNNATRTASCRAAGVPVGWVDPLQAEANLVLSGGNSELKPEESDSWTVGFVVAPDMLGGVSLSLDYWDIEITDAINSAGTTQEIVDDCYDREGSELCGLVSRRGDLAISQVRLNDINIGELTAKGLDLQADYTTDFLGFDLDLGLNATYLLEFEELTDSEDPSSLQIKDGEIAHPKLQFTLVTQVIRGPWKGALTTRYVDSVKVDNQATAEEYDITGASSKTYNDLLVSYTSEEDYELYAGVNNLFDVIPPRLNGVYHGGSGASQTDGAGGLYDNVGRFFFVGAKLRF